VNGITAAEEEVAITGIQTFVTATGTQGVIDHFASDAARLLVCHSFSLANTHRVLDLLFGILKRIHSGTIQKHTIMDHLKIILLCLVSAVVYGILHDQVTVRICLEYFTVFHPPIFPTQSPTLLALGWGVVATWWVGLFLGLLLALAARAGSRPKLCAIALIRPISQLLVVMACCALIAGATGFFLASSDVVEKPLWMGPALFTCSYPRLMADWFAHNASYASGLLGGIVLCVLQYRRRGRTGGM
jgi:hypothetical protein